MAGTLPESGGVLTYSSVAAINAFLAAQGIITQGNVYWVRPTNGSDVNNGKSPATAVATVQAALALASPNQNDVVLLCAEGNSATATTSRYNGLLDWNKDLVHLIGVNSGPQFSSRSRIAFPSTYTGATDLFKVSANGCLIAGIEFFMGVASANPTGCMTVTGQRNHFLKCQISGMGNSANDIASAYSLQLNGAQENLFEDCVIGQNTVTLGAATNSVVLFTNGVTRNTFRNCTFELYTSSATACLFLRSGATAMDREQTFQDCLFVNAVPSGATALTHAFAVVAGTSPAGCIVLSGAKTGLVGASGWNSTASGNVFAVGGDQPTAATWGLDAAVTS